MYHHLPGRLPVGVALLVAALVVLEAMHGAGHVHAQNAACAATVNDVPVEQYTDYRDALELQPEDEIRVAFATLAPGGTTSGSVAIEFGPMSFQLESFQTSGGTWIADAPVRVGDHAQGAGLYRVVVDAEGCDPIAGWINLVGTNPLMTPIGGGAAAGGLVGLLVVVGMAVRGFALGRGFRLRRGLLLTLAGAALVGLAGCVLSQQFGRQPITWEAWATWTAPFAGFGSIANVGAKLFGTQDANVDLSTSGSAPPPGGETAPAEGGIEASAPPPPPPRPSSPPTAAGPTASPPPAASPPATAGPTAPPPAPPPPATNPPHTELTGSEPVDASETFSAYGLLDCPPVVVAGEEFALEVGIAPEAVTGVSGEAFELPAPHAASYELIVDLDLEGFTLRESVPRIALPITAADRYPSAVVHLTADALAGAGPDLRSIRALYVLDGAVVGYARRLVAVAGSAADLEGTSPPAEERGSVAIPTESTAADLTVVIERDDTSRGRLRWTFTTPHFEVPAGPPVVTDVGEEPEQFARLLIDGVGAREGGPGLEAYLLGVGHTIAEEFPAEFWAVLEQVAEHAGAAGRPPSVFLLSEEPYVPWELAVVDPPIDAEAPPFLGAQVQAGRWVLGNRRPKLPPPAEVSVTSMAVISGEYTLPGWSRLAEAEAEAASLAELYAAIPVDAMATDVLACLGGTPAAELLHFAMHGIYDPNSTLNGLVLADGQTIDPLQVRGVPYASPRFVFLNACQVGSSQRILGDYAGLAEAFLFSGAAGVIAPLWSIKDTIAREIALRFYEQSFEGVPPAEILRRERAAFEADGDAVSATSLAYLFYGHPLLRLHRKVGGDA